MPTELDLKEFASLFEHFRQSAFRLETLDHYLVPQEEMLYAQFLRGETPPPSGNEDWCQLVRRNIRAGKVMERVHVVPTPLSQYVKFEIAWGYVHNAAAGEKVYLLNRSDLTEGKAALGDYWLFDDNTLVLMEYGEDGRFIGVSRESDPTTVARYVEAACVLKSLSMSLGEYLDKNPIT